MEITQSNMGFSVATAVCLFEMALSFSTPDDIRVHMFRCEKRVGHQLIEPLYFIGKETQVQRNEITYLTL